MKARKRLGFTLVEMLVVLSIIGLLLALLLPAVQATRESSRCAQCANNLRQFGVGVQNYVQTWGKSPDVGTVLATSGSGSNFSSYIEGQNVYNCPTVGTVVVSATAAMGSSSTITSALSYGVSMGLPCMMADDSGKIIMTDATTQVLEYENLDQQDWNQDIAPRHAGLMNTLYFDGHVLPQSPSAVNPYALVISQSSSAYQDSIDVVSALWRPYSGTCASTLNACGVGLLGTYYYDTVAGVMNNQWNGPSCTRVDPCLTLPFGGIYGNINAPYNLPCPGATAGSSIPIDTATWTGWIKSDTSEPKTFWLRVDNAASVYINGQLVVSRSTGYAATLDWQASDQPVNMVAGQWVDIEIEYEQFGWGTPAHVSLQWSSPSQSQCDIPTCNLWPASASSSPSY